MKTRIISGFCMAPLVGIVYLGDYWLAALVFLIGIIGMREFFNGFRAMGIHPSDIIAYEALISIFLIHYFAPVDMRETFILAWFVAVIMLCSIYMFRVTEKNPVDAMATIVGIVYIGFFSYHMILIDELNDYRILIWLVMLAAFGSDIFAYFTGVFFGKHKMASNLSPKKTVEGAVGGIVGSAVVCGLFGYFLAPSLMIHAIIIGLAGAPISMCGDLTASAYKRKMGIKDYGKLIPGHGGIMDRFDSILFTAPFVYYYIILVIPHFK